MKISRRDLLAAIPPTAGFAITAPPSPYPLRLTTHTGGGWEKDVFHSFREAHEAGFRYVESFINYFMSYLDKPAELRKQIDDIGVKFVTISNGGPLEMGHEVVDEGFNIAEASFMRFAK